MNRRATLFLPVLLAILPLSCGSSTDSPPVEESPAAQTYEGVGTIVEIREGSIVLEHDDIPGFMEGMTMPYPVSDPAILDELEDGMVVRFFLTVDGQSYVIDRIETGAERAEP